MDNPSAFLFLSPLKAFCGPHKNVKNYKGLGAGAENQGGKSGKGRQFCCWQNETTARVSCQRVAFVSSAASGA